MVWKKVLEIKRYLFCLQPMAKLDIRIALQHLQENLERNLPRSDFGTTILHTKYIFCRASGGLVYF